MSKTERDKKIVDMYNNGYSIRDIWKESGVQSKSTVYSLSLIHILFLPGISAAKDIPQQIRMDMVVVLIGQCAIFELHTAVIDTLSLIHI